MAKIKPKFGIVQFPGTNCEYDAQHVLREVFQVDADILWHQDRLKKGHDYQCLILPGGFSYGDYLRSGSMAILSPIIADVVEFAERGGLVLGICNGFQVLTELRLLPGALLKNSSLKFACTDVTMRLENASTPFTCAGKVGDLLKMPIAHGDGCYFIDPPALKELDQNHQVILRYVGKNPNGSLDGIAAISNLKGNVMGLMPHPERCSEFILGGTDGKLIFASILKSLN